MTQRRVIQNECPYLLTTNVRGGEPFFQESENAAALSKVIRTTCSLKNFQLLVYCIMPDHVHIIVAPMHGVEVTAGRAARARGAGTISIRPERPAAAAGTKNKTEYTVSDLMHGVKSYFVHALRAGSTDTAFAWQPRFHSRILNTEQYFRTAIEYVRTNPEKVGLPLIYLTEPYLLIDEVNIGSYL